MDNILTKDEILNQFTIGFEFELFTKFEKKDAAKLLSKVTGKKIVIPTIITELDKEITPVHSDFHPTANDWKLESDYSGGKEMLELVTGPLSYSEARLQLINILNWIEENGWTTKRSGIHINVGIKDYKSIGLINDIRQIDRLKMCLHFDEEPIYKLFPDRRDNVYADTMKTILPSNPFVFSLNYNSVNRGSYLVPSTKYFGVNFIKQEHNYLEFRYLGGFNYHKKIQEILSLVEYFSWNIYEVLKNPFIEKPEMILLHDIMQKHKKIVSSFSDYDSFVINYPDIKITIDLSNNKEIITTFYTNILRDKIYNLIVFCHMTKGEINYDRELGKVQVRNATLTKCSRLSDLQFVNCEINGLISDSEFYNCTIDNSIIEHCKLKTGNLVTFSKIKECPIQINNKIVDCYIENGGFMMNGTLDKCIIRNGNPSVTAVVKDCLFVETNKLNKRNKNTDKYDNSTYYGKK